MFCPTCGKDNARELKYCASCGTNLVAVSQAISGGDEDFFTRMDTSLDSFIARYAERVFKNASQSISDHKVSRSWILLGQGIVTTLVDLFLFLLMWNFLPLRLIILVISTPFRLLVERSKNIEAPRTPSFEDYRPPALLNEREWSQGTVPSVIDNTTLNLGGGERTAQKRVLKTDELQ